jgi:hypothetical protein
MHAPPLLLRFCSIYNSKILQKQKTDRKNLSVFVLAVKTYFRVT